MAVPKNVTEFYEQILTGIGAPITEENMKFLIAWQQAEGGKATNNPFNTSYDLDVDADKTTFNSHGVKNYSSSEYGAIATIKTLKLSYYKNIVKDLRNNSGAKNIAANTEEFNTWGTGNGILRVLNKGKRNTSVSNKDKRNVSVSKSSSKKYHPLTEWALQQQTNWKGLKESDKGGLEILKQYNKNIGTKFNASDHWSAITMENAMMAANGFQSVAEAKKAGVNLSHKSHSDYVNEGYEAARNPNYKYNKYISERLTDSEIKNIEMVGGKA